MRTHQHLIFKKHWELTSQTLYQLGECDALVQAISNIPLKPENRDKLLQVALIKGAQATTAIEGNTLSDEEIKKIQEGLEQGLKKNLLPPSRQYQEIEVRNIINAFNRLLKEVVFENKINAITPELIKKFHKMISKDLGKHIDAIPGKFREDNRIVGTYRSPEYKYIPDLIKKLCGWIKTEFYFDKNRNQDFATAVIEAIATHVYIEWIHPFGDGNGRTGRLIEFYILLRAGLPNIVSHILSNFYNKTRSEYYRQFDNARKNKDLTSFIEYAVQGFRDGLKESLEIIQKNQFKIFWHNYIYETFADIRYSKREAFKRKRDLILELPTNQNFFIQDIVMLTPLIAKKYAKLTITTLIRDLKELEKLKLIKKTGKKYQANIEILKAMIPVKKTVSKKTKN
ncbi:MAG: Fic family protein [Deltaproteobacteria bacterium]|nr:Fic family protein [Deltaproteobacteria bacterium]